MQYWSLTLLLQNVLSISTIHPDTNMKIFSSNRREHHELVLSRVSDETQGLDRQLHILNTVNCQLQRIIILSLIYTLSNLL
jgi:hypothetical protein